MASAEAILIRFPGTGLVLAEFTAAHPLCTVEATLESARLEGGRASLSVRANLRGVEESQIKRLVGDLCARYGPVGDAGHDSDGWTIRFSVGFHEIESEAARYLLGFQTEFGLPWLRIEKGTVTVVAANTTDALGRGRADDIRAWFRERGIPATIATVPAGLRPLAAGSVASDSAGPSGTSGW